MRRHYAANGAWATKGRIGTPTQARFRLLLWLHQPVSRPQLLPGVSVPEREPLSAEERRAGRRAVWQRCGDEASRVQRRSDYGRGAEVGRAAQGRAVLSVLLADAAAREQRRAAEWHGSARAGPICQHRLAAAAKGACGDDLADGCRCWPADGAAEEAGARRQDAGFFLFRQRAASRRRQRSGFQQQQRPAEAESSAI